MTGHEKNSFRVDLLKLDELILFLCFKGEKE